MKNNSKGRRIAAKAAPTSPTLSVPEGGAYFYGLGKNGSYRAAARGDLITINVGRLLRVPVAAMERKLAEAGSK
jgi:hypothetical protein